MAGFEKKGQWFSKDLYYLNRRRLLVLTLFSPPTSSSLPHFVFQLPLKDKLVSGSLASIFTRLQNWNDTWQTLLHTFLTGTPRKIDQDDRGASYCLGCGEFCQQEATSSHLHRHLHISPCCCRLMKWHQGGDLNMWRTMYWVKCLDSSE